VKTRIHSPLACRLAAVAVLGLFCPDLTAQTDSQTARAPKSSSGIRSAVLLEVVGEVSRPLSFSVDDFAKLPRQSVRATGHDKIESVYQGVSLGEILVRSGAASGSELRGKALSLYVVVEASDGYRAVFALPELDAAFSDRVILVADRRDERPLDAHNGPLQIVVPGEKRHGRWVRQVVRLRIGRA
jgi:DMSO/TMAO reductase YedYZ molybdopterin-dependent catalytic subunit